MSKRILVCIESYLPGHAGGGPVRALSNLVSHFGEQHEFFILTRDHDYLSEKSYEMVTRNTWISCGDSKVLYASDTQWWGQFCRSLDELKPDFVYLNGLFAPMTRRILAARKKVPSITDIPCIVAPHGNLGFRTLQPGNWKKLLWLFWARSKNLFCEVSWHSGSKRESAQIKRHISSGQKIRCIPMAPPMWHEQEIQISKTPSNHLKLVYFGRISPEKNLSFALNIIKQVARNIRTNSITWDLYGIGPVEKRFARSVKKNLSSKITVRFLPQHSHEQLQEALIKQSYDALLLPSKSENFSFTVLESLSIGIPVILSDQTPWRDLEERGFGWDLPLDRPEVWVEVLEKITRETILEKESRRRRAQAFARDWVLDYPQIGKELFS